MNYPLTRPTAPGDAEQLAPRLRVRDVDEIRAFSGQQPLEALLSSSSAGLSFTGVDEDGPFVMFGVTPYLPDVGSPWLLGSDALVAKHRHFFMERSRHYLQVYHAAYPMLVNYVDARHSDSRIYLRRLGFSIDKFLPAFGYERRPFFRFTKVTPCASQ